MRMRVQAISTGTGDVPHHRHGSLCPSRGTGFRGGGASPRLRYRRGADIEMALRRCSDRTDLDAMLAGGGDGTVSAAAGLAWQSRMPLGIIPAGTMNLFARSLNIPLDIWQAIDALADGDIAAADIGTADDRAFVHQFSAGLHARMVRLRNAHDLPLAPRQDRGQYPCRRRRHS
ncbi:diacylglycerol kinase catalytic domain-containing protein [Ditylenchus destructor]|uniref:Diacylglycerol kinase catalytic domain-containing protein n=1 Tax=Ditylenchus destructor TaxID=166010 RepID=A0AAD4MFF9_9BILA|nr:diacylglycerol kinase catalytic domain-containing protein [Ditylenchus destructor]